MCGLFCFVCLFVVVLFLCFGDIALGISGQCDVQDSKVACYVRMTQTFKCEQILTYIFYIVFIPTVQTICTFSAEFPVKRGKQMDRQRFILDANGKMDISFESN